MPIEQRLIVAADFVPAAGQGREWVKAQVLTLTENLAGTGVYLKVNTALRACGYGLIDDIHAHGLRVFADLKLFDIDDTLATDGKLLQEAKPELLTTVCTVGAVGMRALKAELPDTEVLGVTVLTNLKDADTQAMFTCSVEKAVLRFAEMAAMAKIDGLISSAKEVATLRATFELLMSLNTPAIRPAWSFVEADRQNPDRIMTPRKAFLAGVDRIVVGRPIVKPPQGMTQREAVERILEEIATTLKEEEQA